MRRIGIAVLIAACTGTVVGQMPDDVETGDHVVGEGVYERASRSGSIAEWQAVTGIGLGGLDEWETAALGDRWAASLGRVVEAEWERSVARFDAAGLRRAIDAANRRYLYETDGGGEYTFDEAGDVILQGAEGYEAAAAAWEAEVEDAFAALYTAWEASAEATATEVLGTFEGAVRERVASELAVSVGEYKAHIEREFRSQVIRSSRRLAQGRLQDSYSMRRQAEEETARSTAGRLIRDTQVRLDEVSAHLAALVPEGDADVGEARIEAEAWQESFEAEFARGLSAWNGAEERFIAERMAWESEAQEQYREAEAAWDEALDEFTVARSGWIAEMESVWREGEDAWARTTASFDAAFSETMIELARASEEELAKVRAESDAYLAVYRQAADVVAMAEENIAALEGMKEVLEGDRTTYRDQRTNRERAIANARYHAFADGGHEENDGLVEDFLQGYNPSVLPARVIEYTYKQSNGDTDERTRNETAFERNRRLKNYVQGAAHQGAWVAWLQGRLGVTRHDRQAPIAGIVMDINLIDVQLGMIDENLASVNRELAYWRGPDGAGGVLADFELMRDEAQADLHGMFGALDTYGAALSSGEVEIARLNGMVESLESQLAIAEAVAAYAADTSSDRATLAETEARYAAEVAAFEDAEAAFLAAIGELEAITNTVLPSVQTALAEKQNALNIAEAELDRLTAELAAAEEARRLQDAGVYDNLIEALEDAAVGHAGEGRDAGAETYAQADADALAADRWQTAMEIAADLAGHEEAETDEYTDLTELTTAVEALESLSIDWTTVTADGFTQSVTDAGLDAGAPAYLDLVAAIDSALAVGEGSAERRLRELSAERMLADLADRARLDVARTEYAIDVLEGRVYTEEQTWLYQEEIDALETFHGEDIADAQTALHSAEDAARLAIQEHYEALVTAESEAIATARQDAIATAYDEARAAAIDAGLPPAPDDPVVVEVADAGGIPADPTIGTVYIVGDGTGLGEPPPGVAYIVFDPGAVAIDEATIVGDSEEARTAILVFRTGERDVDFATDYSVLIDDLIRPERVRLTYMQEAQEAWNAFEDVSISTLRSYTVAYQLQVELIVAPLVNIDTPDTPEPTIGELRAMYEELIALDHVPTAVVDLLGVYTQARIAEAGGSANVAFVGAAENGVRLEALEGALYTLESPEATEMEREAAAAAVGGSHDPASVATLRAEYDVLAVRNAGAVWLRGLLDDSAQSTYHHLTTASEVIGGIDSSSVIDVIDDAVATLDAEDADDVTTVVAEESAYERRAEERRMFLGAEATYLGALVDLADTYEVKNAFQSNIEQYVIDVVEPLRDDVERQRQAVNGARREYDGAIAAFEAAVTTYEERAADVDAAQLAYTDTRRAMQEAEEIMDYARTGYMTAEIDPAAVVAERTAELERTRTALALVVANADEVTDATRDDEYVDLVSTEAETMNAYQEGAVASETLGRQTAEAEGALQASRASIARTASQLVTGAYSFSPDYDSVSTARISSDSDRFDADTYFTGEWDENLSTDMASWMVAMNQLGGNALYDMGLALYYEIHYAGSYGGDDHRVGEASILTNQTFVKLMDKANVRMDPYTHRYTGLTIREGTLNWELEQRTRAAYNRVRATSLSRGAYRFFAMLTEGGGPVELDQRQVRAINNDVSKIAHDFVDDEARDRQRSLTKWYRSPGKKREGRRIKQLRRQDPDLSGKDQRSITMQLFADGSRTIGEQNTLAADVARITGNRPDANEVIASLTAAGVAGTSARLQQAIRDVVATGNASETATSLSVMAAAQERLARDMVAAGEAVNVRVVELQTEQHTDQVNYEEVLGRYLRGEDVSEADLEVAARARFAGQTYDTADHMAYRLTSLQSVADDPANTNDEARAVQLSIISNHIYDAAAARMTSVQTEYVHQFTVEYEALTRRHDSWSNRMESLVAAGAEEWDHGYIRLAGQRKRFQEETAEEYAEAAAVWDLRYEALIVSRDEWIDGATHHAVRAGSEAAARQMGLDAEYLIARSEAIAVPDLTIETGDLELAVRQATDDTLLTDMISAAGAMAGRAGETVVIAAYLPGVRSTTDSAESARGVADALGEEIQQHAMRVTALQMNEQIRESIVAVDDGIDEANRSVSENIDTTMERAGYRLSGREWNRRVIIDETLFGGIERETHRVEDYRDFTVPVFEATVDLSEEALDGLSSRGIRAMIDAAYEEMERYQILIFGRSEAQKTDGAAVMSIEELNGALADRFAAVEASWTRAAGYNRTRENEESGEEEYLHHDTEGLFNYHVGYAPVMKTNKPEEVREAGYGEMGRIMEDFYRNEARVGRGLAMIDVPLHRMRMWDDDADNDGNPDGLFGAPNITTVTSVAVGIATGGAGFGAVLASVATNAVFTMADVATGYADADDAFGSFAKSTAVSLATAGVGYGFDKLGTAATAAVEGSKAITQTAVNVGMSTAQAVTTTAVSSAINSFSIDGDWDVDFDERGFRRATFGESAVAGYAGGAAQGFVNGTLENFLTTDGIGDKLAGNTFDLRALSSAARLTASGIGAATDYLIDGSTSLSILDARIFNRRAPGEVPAATDGTFVTGLERKGLSGGLINLQLGGNGALFGVGGGSYDVGVDLVGQSLAGIGDIARVTGAKVGGALGTQRGRENRAILNGVNRLGYTNIENNHLTADALWNRELQADFRDLEGDALGMYDAGSGSDRVVFDESFLANDTDTASKLAAVMSHEGTHVAGNAIEGVAYVFQAETYSQLVAHGLANDTEFLAETYMQVGTTENWQINDQSQPQYARPFTAEQARETGYAGVYPTLDAVPEPIENFFNVTLGGDARNVSTWFANIRGREHHRHVSAAPLSDEQIAHNALVSGVSIAATLVTAGLSRTLTTATALATTASTAAITAQAARVTSAFATSYTAANEIFDLFTLPEGETSWHHESGRDNTIFGLAEEAEIDLAFAIEPGMRDAHIEELGEVGSSRYRWLGDRIYEDGITDPDELNLLFHGGHMKDTDIVGEEYDPDTLLPTYPGVEMDQYIEVPGYVDFESLNAGTQALTGLTSSSWLREYTETMNMANLKVQSGYRYSSLMSPDYLEDLYRINNDPLTRPTYQDIADADQWVRDYEELISGLLEN